MATSEGLHYKPWCSQQQYLVSLVEQLYQAVHTHFHGAFALSVAFGGQGKWGETMVLVYSRGWLQTDRISGVGNLTDFTWHRILVIEVRPHANPV